MTAIRLHDPTPRDDWGGEPSAEWTLTRLVEQYYKPITLLASDARPRNIEEIDQSVKYWARFTGDPPLREITARECCAFVVRLKELPGKRQTLISPNTVRKHCGAIQTILDLCGPPDRKHRDSLGILERPPYIVHPKEQKKPAEDFFEVAELELLLANADAAQWPNGVPGCTAGNYLRRIYILIFNTGLRIGSVCTMCWSHYHGDHLLLPPRDVVKGNDWKRIEVNEFARAVIESMHGADSERIFPRPRAWPGSKKLLFDQHATVRMCLPPERRFAFHAIRKLYNNELARINAAACMKALGHANGRTTIEHYQTRKIVAEAQAQLPTLKWSNERQAQLFD